MEIYSEYSSFFPQPEPRLTYSCGRSLQSLQLPHKLRTPVGVFVKLPISKSHPVNGPITIGGSSLPALYMSPASLCEHSREEIYILDYRHLKTGSSGWPAKCAARWHCSGNWRLEAKRRRHRENRDMAKEIPIRENIGNLGNFPKQRKFCFLKL